MAAEWITKALEANPDKSKGGIAKAIGKNASAVSSILAGTRRIQLEELPKIERYLGVKAPPELLNSGSLASSFDPDDPDPVEPFEAEAPDSLDPDQPPEIPQNGIVEADTRFGMGPGGAVNEAGFIYHRDGEQVRSTDAIKPDPWIFPTWFLQMLGAKPGELMMAEARGDSMRPTIEPGMPLLIDLRYRVPSPDGIYAIRDRWGALQFKRLETAKGAGDTRIKVISDNGGHVDVVADEDTIHIVGKVIGGWKPF